MVTFCSPNLTAWNDILQVVLTKLFPYCDDERSCNKCGKTVNCSRLKLLLHAGLITHLTCRHTRKRKPYAALQLKLALNRNVLWIFALVLHHTTTCFSENCPFPICVRSSPYHGTSDHDGQRKWKIVYFFIFEIQSTTSGRLANYIRAFCHFLFCFIPCDQHN